MSRENGLNHPFPQPETKNRVLVLIMEGKSLRDIEKIEGMPNKSTVCEWVVQDEGWAEHYARARDVQVEMHVEEMLELRNEVLDDARAGNKNIVLVSAANLATKILMWEAERLMPKKYSQRLQQVNKNENINLNVTVSDADTAAAILDKTDMPAKA